jgi:hypothetical protein
MANLVETGRPYLHMRAGTFVKNLSVEYHPSGKNSLRLNTTVLEKLLEKARVTEKQFYIDFGVSGALEYSEKYLARDYGSREQIAFQIWNSSEFRKYLYNKRSNTEIINLLQGKIGKILTAEMMQELKNSEDIEKTISDILRQLLIQLDVGGKNVVPMNTQKKIREAIMGKTKKKMRSLTTGGGVIPKMVQEIVYDKGKLKHSPSKLYQIFKEMFLARTGEKDSPAIDEFLAPYEKELLNNKVLLSNQRSNVTGEFGETGEAITIELSIKNDPKLQGMQVERTSNKPVSRVGLPKNQTVKSKIDMTVTSPSGRVYYFQQKNSDKSLFLEFEKLGLMNMKNESLFFNAHGKVSMETFRKQVEAIMGQTESHNLDILEYLLVNINVLNKGYKGPTLYKRETPDGAGVYSHWAMKMLSDIVSQYCQVYFSDLIEETNSLKINSYDFITFKGRILIPMSEIYEGFLKNLKDTETKINKNSTYLDVGTTLSSKYTKSDFKKMVKAKENAVGKYGFWENGNYQLRNLVTAGKDAGAEVLDKTQIGNFTPNINLASLIPKIDY